jgi:hypothetical protein
LNELKGKNSGNLHLAQLIDKLVSGKEIKDEFYDFHMNVQYVNLSKTEIINALR